MFGLGPRTLTGRFTCAIEIKDDPLAALSIDQAPGLLLVGKRATEQIIEKERAQGFDGSLGQRRRAKRTPSLILVRTPCLRRCAAISTTSSNTS